MHTARAGGEQCTLQFMPPVHRLDDLEAVFTRDDRNKGSFLQPAN
jgi:hypothetical protein